MASNLNVPTLDRVTPLLKKVHGRVSTYKRHGCRCLECVDAKRAYDKGYKNRVKLGLVVRRTAEHGTTYMYTAHKCRCELCRDANSVAHKEYRLKFWDNELAKRRYRLYGIDVTAYDEMLESQNGLCAICQESEPTCVDHNHTTGSVRGLLCAHCNKAIGFLKDNPVIAELASKYLKEKN